MVPGFARGYAATSGAYARKKRVENVFLCLILRLKW